MDKRNEFEKKDLKVFYIDPNLKQKRQSFFITDTTGAFVKRFLPSAFEKRRILASGFCVKVGIGNKSLLRINMVVACPKEAGTGDVFYLQLTKRYENGVEK